MKEKQQFKTWFCGKCGAKYKLEIEEDKITTRMWCKFCNSVMYRVKLETLQNE